LPSERDVKNGLIRGGESTKGYSLKCIVLTYQLV